MRTASRVFISIGLFGVLAGLLFGISGRLRHENIQGPFILLVFALACLFLALFLGRQGSLEVDWVDPPGADEHVEIHLPGPSWYPALYGVACLVLVLGLVYNKTALIAGVVALVLTTIGWGVESVREYRREIAHHKPAAAPPSAAVDLAHQVLAFRRAHGGAEAVVQHLGRGGAEVVLVGGDGAWGSLVTRDVAIAREAAALAGTTVHESWPSGLGSRVRNGEDTWRAMGGESALSAPTEHAPRDGSTQSAAKVFLSLAIFALLADVFYASAARFHRANVQAIAILTAFGLANAYLYIGLKNAKARPEDLAFAGDGDVTIEPSEPSPPVDLETLHLPGPSWWPALFPVALGLLVWGLVYSTGILIAGLVTTVGCCIGWGIESVHEYRQTIAGHH